MRKVPLIFQVVHLFVAKSYPLNLQPNCLGRRGCVAVVRALCVQTDAIEAEDKRGQQEIMDDKSISVPGAIQVFCGPQVPVGLTDTCAPLIFPPFLFPSVWPCY